MGTVIVGILVACGAAFAVRSIYKDRKNGKHSCCGDCGRCRGRR